MKPVPEGDYVLLQDTRVLLFWPFQRGLKVSSGTAGGTAEIAGPVPFRACTASVLQLRRTQHSAYIALVYPT